MTLLSWRSPAIAVLWGALAGAVAALVYATMTSAQHVIWPAGYARWYIPVMILAGGLLVAVLRPWSDEGDLDTQLRAAANPARLRRRRTAVLALSAIIAYGFGGAIGPEAGLVAVVAELSAIVGLRIARTEAEARLIGESGSGAALAGLYGSPPGAAAYGEDALTPSRLLSLVAAGSGFIAFLAVHHGVGAERVDLGIPRYVHSTSQLLAALVPALFGAGIGLAYTALHRATAKLIARLGSLRRQSIIGSVALAGLATAFPVALFSGHDQFHELAAMVESSAGTLLLGVALVKICATSITLSSGWRGGEFFPLLFAGAAVGSATSLWVPGLELATAQVAGLTAATATGLKKPIAAVLVCALLIGQPAWGPLIVGAVMGAVVLGLVDRSPQRLERSAS